MNYIKTFLCIIIFSFATIQLGAVTIGDAKILPDNTNITLTGKIVSKVFSDGIFYVQEPDRSAGIRISSTTANPSVGDIVNISGTLLTYYISSYPVKRYISASSVVKTDQTAAPSPFGMLSKSVGGAAVPPNLPGILNSQGPNNMGLLAKIFGAVTGISGNRVIVDDGVGIVNENGFKGVTVITYDTPDLYVGEFVNATGVISGWLPSGFNYIVPAILLSDISDIQLVGKDGETGILTGTVTNTFNELLENVNVQLTPSLSSTNTNNQGVYSFNSLPVGTYKAVFSKSGYNTIEKTVNVHNAMTNYLNVVMQSQTGRLRIIVKDDQDRPLNHAGISINPGENLLFTNSNGIAEINNLNPGSYNIRVCIQGYESFLQSGVVINAGELKILNVSLNRVSFSSFINNGDFECAFDSGIAAGWKKWQSAGSNAISYSVNQTNHLAGSATQRIGRSDSLAFNGGIVTKVPTQIGVKYEVSAWVRMDSNGSNTWLALGVDTTGQIDNGVNNTINYKNFESQGNRKWHRYRQIITATSDGLSVFIKYGKTTGGSGSNYAFVDNVTVQPYIELEAEDYDTAYDTTSGNAGGEYRDGDVDIYAKPGGGYVVGNTATNEWLQWNNIGSIGGEHLFVIDYSGIGSSIYGYNPELRLFVNGTNVTGNFELPKTGNYDAYRKYVHPILINIPQGTNNTIRLTFQTPRSNIDKIALIPISKSIKIEAEDYQSYYDTTAQNEGGQYRNDGVDIGLNSGVYFVGWTAANEWLEYHLKGDSRTYAIFFRYAGISNATFDLLMNDYPIIENISLPSTNGWYNWQFKYAGIVTANTGDNVLRIFMKSGGFNLDYIVLVPIGDGNAGSDLLTGVHFAGDSENGILDFASERDSGQWIYTTEAFVNNDRDPDTNSELINWMNTWINGQLKSLYQNRIKPIIRIDWKWGETIPRLLPNNEVDNQAVSRYARTFRKFAQLADASGVPIRHFIVANEMNLKGEANGFANGYIPEWYYAYVYDVVKNEMAQLGAGYEVMVGAVSPGTSSNDPLQPSITPDPNVYSVDGLVYLENVIKELKRKATSNPDFALHAYADFDNRFNYTINFYWVLRKQLELIMKTHTVVPYNQSQSVAIPGYANANVYITEWNRHTPVNSSEGRVEQEKRTSAFIRTAIERINRYNVNREIFNNQTSTYNSYDHRGVAHNFLPIKGMCYFVFNDDPLWNDYSLKYWHTLSGSATGDDDMYNTYKSYLGRRYPGGR